jgi:hypothetical protein
MEGRSIEDVDYARSLTTGGLTAGGGAVLGWGMASANVAVATGSRFVVGGLSVAGAGQGGYLIGEGLVEGNGGKVALGTSFVSGSFAAAGLISPRRVITVEGGDGRPAVRFDSTSTHSSGETAATISGKAVHRRLANERRASGEFDLVNQPIRDAAGNPIQVPRRIDLKSGEPSSDPRTQTAIPDAVRYERGLVLDDKPLGRPVSKDRQEIVRFIRAYEQSQGSSPRTIAIQRYDPTTGDVVVTELYTPAEFLPSN